MRPDSNEAGRVAQEWLRAADEDLAVARVLAVQGPDCRRAALFHCQQCAEKSLKALLAYRQVDVPRTHDLKFLLTLCSRAGASLDETLGGLPELSDYAVDSRYPPLESHAASEVSRALELALQARVTVGKRLQG